MGHPVCPIHRIPNSLSSTPYRTCCFKQIYFQYFTCPCGRTGPRRKYLKSLKIFDRPAVADELPGDLLRPVPVHDVRLVRHVVRQQVRAVIDVDGGLLLVAGEHQDPDAGELQVGDGLGHLEGEEERRRRRRRMRKGRGRRTPSSCLSLSAVAPTSLGSFSTRS